ncbi:MAG: MSCRAMM family protein [Candidatus Limnocylindria bacterium]
MSRERIHATERHRFMHLTVIILAASLLLGACAPQDEPTRTLQGVATAGPTCPVETEPPDPSCADRPVGGAVIVVNDETGSEVARVTTGEDGSFSVDLAPGSYVLVPQPVAGLMGTAAPIEVVVPELGDLEPLAVSYDTGIR